MVRALVTSLELRSDGGGSYMECVADVTSVMFVQFIYLTFFCLVIYNEYIVEITF